jgi:hypothetical protein
VKKSNKELLFERMHIIGGMPLKEFNLDTTNANQLTYKNLIDFIGESTGYLNYLHTTNSEANAKSICDTGLRFEEFEKTTDYISNVTGLVYMLNIRAAYGNFTVIIQIKSSIKDMESISKKTTNEDGEEIFILPPQYIKGYYDRNTQKIFSNPLFKQ